MKTLRIDGEVVDLTPVVDELKQVKEDVELIINSPGGDVFAGLQVVKAIENCRYQVTAKVEVMAASIAAIIALACDKIIIGKNDLMMLHNSWTYAAGNKDELKNYIEAMTAVDKVLHSVIEEHCTDPGLISRIDDGDVWLVGEEVAELFDNVELAESNTQNRLVACASLAKLVKAAKEETDEERRRKRKMNVPPEEEPSPDPDETPDEEETPVDPDDPETPPEEDPPAEDTPGAECKKKLKALLTEAEALE